MGYNFGDTYARAEFVTLADVAVPVLALDDLIALKRGVGRAKDMADVEALEEIARIRENR